MRVKGRPVVIDLVQEHPGRIVWVLADIELPASRLVADRRGGVLRHQRQKRVKMRGVNLEFDGDHIHGLSPCQPPDLTRSRRWRDGIRSMSPPNSMGRSAFAAPASTSSSISLAAVA